MSAKKQTSALQLAQKEPDQSSESQLPVKRKTATSPRIAVSTKNVSACLLRISWFWLALILTADKACGVSAGSGTGQSLCVEKSNQPEHLGEL